MPVNTKDRLGKVIERVYFIDINKALNPQIDMEDAIISVPADDYCLKNRNDIIADYSTMEKQSKAEVLPLSIILITAF